MVYPGILTGGFGDFSADSSKGNVFGARLHHSHGAFGGDLILDCELDIPPTFDWSLAYLGRMDWGALRLGASGRLRPRDVLWRRCPGHEPVAWSLRRGVRRAHDARR